MRTRCPQCDTVFRITPEQLRARGGRVRCGSCQHIFNAFEYMQEGASAPTKSRSALPGSSEAPVANAASPLPTYTPPVVPAPVVPVDSPEIASAIAVAVAFAELEVAPEEVKQEPFCPAEPAVSPSGRAPYIAAPSASLPMADVLSDEAVAEDETPEQSTEAARQAGLMAARELAETPAYNRWAAGTLAGNSFGSLAPIPNPAPIWPFVLGVLFLSLLLAVQAGWHYRTELCQRLPVLRSVYGMLDIAVPLPRIAEQVSIETSDLQSDAGRGLLVLQATLKNKASFAQAWPALELTLTDTQDQVVSRRVLLAEEYLPAGVDSRSFAPYSETGLRLWLESREVAAAGYRLYVFYP